MNWERPRERQSFGGLFFSSSSATSNDNNAYGRTAPTSILTHGAAHSHIRAPGGRSATQTGRHIISSTVNRGTVRASRGRGGGHLWTRRQLSCQQPSQRLFTQLCQLLWTTIYSHSFILLRDSSIVYVTYIIVFRFLLPILVVIRFFIE